MKPKILVVDDEPDTVELIDFHLKHAGYDVLTAGDGNAALERTRASFPDLMVLDLMLPGIDGLEICKIIRRDPDTVMRLSRRRQLFGLARTDLSKLIDLLLRLEVEVHQLRRQVKKLKARLSAGSNMSRAFCWCMA